MNKFCFYLIEGEAKNEVKFRSQSSRDIPNKIFNILLETYGASQSFVSLQKLFFQRKQKEGESVREYSHALLSLMRAIMQSKPGGVPGSDILVRDQFIEHMRDGMLRRELKRYVRLNPDSSFLTVRNEAVSWVEEGEQVPAPRTRAFSCDSRVHVVEDCAVKAGPKDELVEVKECLHKQQAQLDAILKQLNDRSPPVF